VLPETREPSNKALCVAARRSGGSLYGRGERGLKDIEELVLDASKSLFFIFRGYGEYLRYYRSSYHMEEANTLSALTELAVQPLVS